MNLASHNHHQIINVALFVQLVLNFDYFLQLCRYK